MLPQEEVPQGKHPPIILERPPSRLAKKGPKRDPCKNSTMNNDEKDASRKK